MGNIMYRYKLDFLSIFNENCIYLPTYLNDQICKILNDDNIISGKKTILFYCPFTNYFMKNTFSIVNLNTLTISCQMFEELPKINTIDEFKRIIERNNDYISDTLEYNFIELTENSKLYETKEYLLYLAYYLTKLYYKSNIFTIEDKNDIIIDNSYNYYLLNTTNYNLIKVYKKILPKKGYYFIRESTSFQLTDLQINILPDFTNIEHKGILIKALKTDTPDILYNFLDLYKEQINTNNTFSIDI